MSRELHIEVLCDPCGAEDVRSPGVEWLLEVQGQRRVVDLCQMHVDSWGLDALAIDLPKYGRVPEQSQQQPTTRVRSHRPDPPTGAGFACPEPGCDRSFGTAQGLTMHRTRSHSPSGAAWGTSGAH